MGVCVFCMCVGGRVCVGVLDVIEVEPYTYRAKVMGRLRLKKLGRTFVILNTLHT